MPLSPTATENVKSTLDGVVKEGAAGLAGVVFIAIDKSGQPLIQHASGTRSLHSTDAMDFDTTFWIASCTKLLTAIAAYQQIEAGKIPLDDAAFVAQHAPEIKAKKVYADGVTPAEQQKQVTMRMLLSHTAGFAYSFLDPRVQGVDEFAGLQDEIVKSPMVNQPGGVWEYSVSLDWVGIILERYLGQKLGDVFQKNILAPLGIKDMTMTPTPEMRQNLAQVHQRDMSTGEIKERNYLYEAGLYSAEKAANEQFHSGGAGLFAKPVEYVKVLGALLNGGKSPETGERILKEESVDAMWENQIPGQPDFARGRMSFFPFCPPFFFSHFSLASPSSYHITAQPTRKEKERKKLTTQT